MSVTAPLRNIPKIERLNKSSTSAKIQAITRKNNPLTSFSD